MPVGPAEWECEAPMRIACAGMPHFAPISFRAASTVGRRMISASIPTSATRRSPSSNTTARTLHGSWRMRCNTFEYPPGCSMPISGVMSRSAKPALNDGCVCGACGAASDILRAKLNTRLTNTHEIARDRKWLIGCSSVTGTKVFSPQNSMCLRLQRPRKLPDEKQPSGHGRHE